MQIFERCRYLFGGTRKQGYSSVYGGMSRGITWQVENTLTYQKTFAEKHNLTVMLGQTALSNTGRQVGASRKYLIEEATGPSVWLTLSEILSE